MSRIHKLENFYKELLKDKDIKNTSEFLQSILDVDITKGKYVRFLIEAFLNDKFLEEDLIGGVVSTVGQAINLFDKHKNKLPLEHRSVYALDKETGEALYQSPGDLWNSVKQFQGELSGKELKKEEQEQVYRETEFVYKDENTGFQIISPLTEDSAKWWGKGTRWCTSAEKNNMFWYYAKDSPLFITLMPNGDKLQLWKNGNKIQFMDEADNRVSLDYIEQHWNILEPICKWLNDLRFIPEELKTQELCESAVQKDGWSLYYVPKEYKTPELCKIAIQEEGHSLNCIPKELITFELCELAVQKAGYTLRFAPLYLRTKELCELAIHQNGLALEYVPYELRTKEICLEAVKQNGKALGHVLEEHKTPELCKLAIQQNGNALTIIPRKYETKELCEIAVQQNGRALKYVPDEYRTKELCELAIHQNGIALNYVPKEIKTPELCEVSVKNHGHALQFVPDELITKELCELAVKQNGMALEFVPAHLKTEELCKLAIQQNKNTLRNVPEKFKDELKHYVKEDFFEIPMEKYQEIYQEIKILFPKKDVSLSYHH